MNKFLAVLFGLILLSIPAVAQVYEGKDALIKAPLDGAIDRHSNMYANVPLAGAYEDVKPQEVRYIEMTDPVNVANERHFNGTISLK